MQFCIVCQSKNNSVRLLCNEHFDSLNAVDNVACEDLNDTIVFKVMAYGASYEYTTAETTNKNM